MVNDKPTLLHTSRGYFLREIEDYDYEFIFKGLSDPNVYRYYGVRLLSSEDADRQMKFYRQLLTENTGRWWIITDDAGTLYGAIGLNDYDKAALKIEIGYWLLPEYWGKGIVYTCLPMAENFARQLFHVHYLVAWVELENISSLKLLKSNGFKVKETRHNGEFKDGRWIDLIILEKELV